MIETDVTLDCKLIKIKKINTIQHIERHFYLYDILMEITFLVVISLLIKRLCYLNNCKLN